MIVKMLFYRVRDGVKDEKSTRGSVILEYYGGGAYPTACFAYGNPRNLLAMPNFGNREPLIPAMQFAFF